MNNINFNYAIEKTKKQAFFKGNFGLKNEQIEN